MKLATYFWPSIHEAALVNVFTHRWDMVIRVDSGCSLLLPFENIGGLLKTAGRNACWFKIRMSDVTLCGLTRGVSDLGGVLKFVKYT